MYFFGFPGSSDGKESASSARDPGSIPGSGRSLGEGNGNPLQYSWTGEPDLVSRSPGAGVPTSSLLPYSHPMYRQHSAFAGVGNFPILKGKGMEVMRHSPGSVLWHILPSFTT